MKNEIKLIELKKWFADIRIITQDAFISFNNLKTVLDTENHKRYYFLREDFFIFYRHQQWFMLIIQLCKLLVNKSNHKRNIISLCDKLINSKYDNDIIKLLESKNNRGHPNFKTPGEVIAKSKEIKMLIDKNQNIINQIHTLRDKVFAHTDIVKDLKLPTLKEIGNLLEIVSFAYNNTRGLFCGIYMDFTRGVINLTIIDIIRIMEEGLPKTKIQKNY